MLFLTLVTPTYIQTNVKKAGINICLYILHLSATLWIVCTFSYTLYALSSAYQNAILCLDINTANTLHCLLSVLSGLCMPLYTLFGVYPTLFGVSTRFMTALVGRYDKSILQGDDFNLIWIHDASRHGMAYA